MAEKAICRVGDHCTGTCTVATTGHPRAFTGTWQTGSTVCSADGIGIVRVGDTGITDCGHTIHASGGSTIGTADGIAIHRVGDPVTIVGGGTGTSTTGSTKHFSN
jgi:hypothetical protein